jgi:nucleotide-binding universal stress UspA family protein
MAIRRILVPLVGIGDAKALLEHAFALAVRLDAEVAVCDTLPRDLPFIDSHGMLSTDISAALIEKLQGEQEEARKAMRAQFDGAVKAAALPRSDGAPSKAPRTQWIDSRDYPRVVFDRARLADLVVARRPPGVGVADQELIEDALFSARRPVLLVPAKAVHLERGAVVAWNGSLEAATALERAVDLLDHGRPVTVVQVGDLRPGALAAAEAQAYLQAHGFEARVSLLADAPQRTGEILLHAANELGAGLLVAGAYSHSRVREALLGGVTATLLAKAHLPVFLAH